MLVFIEGIDFNNYFQNTISDPHKSDIIYFTIVLNNLDSLKQLEAFKNKYRKLRQKIVIFLEASDLRSSIRDGLYVDEHLKYLTQDDYIYITCLDFSESPNIIRVPTYVMPRCNINGNHISQLDNEINIQYNRKIYLKASATHSIRNDIINYLSNKPFCNVSHNNFWADPSNEKNYLTHIDNCINSDIGILIRGDRPACFVFWDYLYAGNIICFINSDTYLNMGLEKIGLDYKDMFLFYDINVNSIEEIYNDLVQLLQNKEKVLKMRQNVRNFYKDYFLKYINKGEDGIGHLIRSKCLELIQNNYNLVDNKIFNQYILDDPL